MFATKYFEGKIFTNSYRFMKFVKIFPLEKNPLYGKLIDFMNKLIKSMNKLIELMNKSIELMNINLSY